MASDGIDIPSPSIFLKPNTPPEPVSHIEQQSRQPQRKKVVHRQSRTKNDIPADQDHTAKPKQSKSRNGCSTCKAKRLKCDEEKPGCQQCARRKVECGGYKKDFKWRPFEETNVKIIIDRQKNAPTRRDAPTGETLCSIPSSSRVKARKINTIGLDEDTTKASGKVSAADESTRILQGRALKKLNDPSYTTRRSSQRGEDVVYFRSSTESRTSSSTSPTMTELLMPISTSAAISEYIPFQLPDDFALLPESDIVFDPEMPYFDEHIEMPNDTTLDDLEWPEDAPEIDASPTSSQTISRLRTPIDYLHSEPSLAPDSDEMLCLRFDRLTCGILSVMDGPTENPWRSLIWPLARDSPALYHAINAMTAFHSSTDVPTLRLAGHEHKQASIRHIQEGIRNNSMTGQTAIATALALGFSESWDQHTASGNTHIKGAQALVKRTLDEHRQTPLQGEELARLKFLCNAWVYMDVIARLTAVDSDESNDFDNTLLFSETSSITSGEVLGRPGFGIDFGMPVDARLDPLMGCASTLFPIIGRVANLVKKVFRSQTNSPAVISQANEFKLLLELWEPPAFIEPPEDPTSQVQHCLQTAEAYRWATLLHLHQSVPELPSLSSADLGRKVLNYLATVPLVSRTVIVQIYPLMVAGCEASTAEDRQWVRDRWAAMEARMRIGVIEKCTTVAEEVWRRRDTYAAQPILQRKLVATADLQLERLGRERLKRPLSGFQDAPGRNGVVFSWVDGEVDETGPRPRRGLATSNIGAMDPAYTVRGHLHWVGVMYDWGWEVLLG